MQTAATDATGGGRPRAILLQSEWGFFRVPGNQVEACHGLHLSICRALRHADI